MLLWILIAAMLSLPSAGNREAATWASRMEARYRGAKTLQATFLERYAENGREVRTESGTAYFRRPGKMRWEYEVPEKNLFLVDGKTAWFYVPGDHTATRVPAKESRDLRTPLALLAGEMKVSRVCARVESAGAEKPIREGDVVLSCKLREPKPAHSGRSSDARAAETSSANDEVLFEIVRDTGELTRLLVRQNGGIEVEFRFENWRMDPAVSDTMFRFTPPEGVAIVNGELPEADAAVR